MQGFAKPLGDGSCDCAADKKKLDANGADICVTTVIEDCIKYESETTCAECEGELPVTEDKTHCGEVITIPVNGSSLISFSLVLALLAIIIIA